MEQLSLNDYSAMSATLPLIAAAINFRQIDRVLAVAVLYFLAAAIFELILMLSMRAGLSNNMPLIHLFIALSMTLFSILYYRAFQSGALRNLVLFLGPASVLVVIVNALFIGGIWTYPAFSNTLQSVVLMAFSLLYFYQIFTRQEYVHIEKQAMFWINSGVLIYFSVNIFLFMLFELFIEHQMEGLYAIHLVINIFSNILYATGLLCKPQTTT